MTWFNCVCCSIFCMIYEFICFSWVQIKTRFLAKSLCSLFLTSRSLTLVMSLLLCCGGILAHSCWQNCYNSATLKSFRAWTGFLRSCHSISIGFKSGLWLGHSKVVFFILFFFSHSEVDFLVCFGSLSCCRTQVRFSLKSRTDGRTLSFSIFWKTAEFMVPFITANLPGPEAAIQPQTITLPPPHFTVGMFFFWNAVLLLRQM